MNTDVLYDIPNQKRPLEKKSSFVKIRGAIESFDTDHKEAF